MPMTRHTSSSTAGECDRRQSFFNWDPRHCGCPLRQVVQAGALSVATIDGIGDATFKGAVIGSAVAMYTSATFTGHGQSATMRMSQVNGNIFFSGQGGIMLNFDQGGYVAFGNGAGVQVGSIDNAGNFHVQRDHHRRGSKELQASPTHWMRYQWLTHSIPASKVRRLPSSIAERA
jgi:hypothetical protein